MDSQCGLGRVRVHMAVNGLEDDDWQHIAAVTARIRLPDGSIQELPAEPDADNRRIEFSLLVEVEGTYKAGCRIDFADGYWVTSQTAHRFNATDGM